VNHMVRAGSVIVLVLLWHAAATLAPSRALPPPSDVLLFVAGDLRAGDMLANIGVTLWRVFASFTVAMTLGSAIGVALGRSRAADRALDTWVVVLLNTPALVITVLCYVWLGLTEVAAIVAVALNKIPNVVVILREGARALDPALDEMSAVYRFSFRTRLRHVLIPQLAPYTMAAARSGLALVWKIVLVVELLGRPNGVGFAISYYFQLFDVRAILGYSMVFTIVMLAIELLVLQPLEVHARRWRPANS